MAAQSTNERIQELRQELAESVDPVTAVKNKVTERVSPIASDVSRKAQSGMDAFNAQVRNHPMAAIVACVAVGWVFGLLRR